MHFQETAHVSLKRVQLLETQCVGTGHPQPPSGALPANTYGAEAEEGDA
jgi:hypothetical protein